MPSSFDSIDDYVAGILQGDRLALSRAITLIESTRKDHQSMAREVVSRCIPHTGKELEKGKGIRIGITGPPGAGKSTFINALGSYLADHGKRIAVLAIDPSSKRSKGSILGDKTRMTRLASHPNAFIRPSPNAGASGGLASRTREALVLCEAAGYDILFIETVGVGQSEFEVHSMVDMLLLLLITGAGDEIQGIKRGIMEMADLIVVNKADGENEREADLLRRSLKHILHMMPKPRPGWHSTVQNVSSLEGNGISEVWNTIQTYITSLNQSGHLEAIRKQQAIDWMHQHIEHQLRASFHQDASVSEQMHRMRTAVENGTKSPIEAAEELLQLFLGTKPETRNEKQTR